MKNFGFLLKAIGTLFLFIALNSCISTEIVEPKKSVDSETKIVLNLSAPEDVKTRADSEYKLRYIAKLYQGSANNINEKTLIRKEIIEGERSEEDVENQIIFNVSPDTYTIFVLADYIPVNSQRNSKGLFDDYFYDTSNKELLTMRTTPGSTENKISNDFFNNDNYDIFYSITKDINKTEEKYIINTELQRIVAKVKLVDTSGLSGAYDLNLSNIGVVNIYDMINSTGGNVRQFERNLLIESQKSFNGESEQDFLYFYTFASTSTTASYLPYINFKLGQDNNIAEIAATNIPVKSNYITVVKGKFLPDNSTDDPGPEEPGIDQGPIYVNMSVNNDWMGTSYSEWNGN